MLIIDRYIARAVVGATLTVLVVLLAIFSFFELIDELEDLGQGAYGLFEIIQVVLLGLPGLAYQLFPIAALIGSLLGLGALAERNEITVLRAAGVSRLRVIRSVMQAGAAFAVLAVIIGELVFPLTARQAQELQAYAQHDHVTASTESGFWARDGNSYINIGEILAEDRFRDIRILEFNRANELRSATVARSARYVDRQWQLEDIERTLFDGNRITAEKQDHAAWSSLLNPELIGMVAVNPDTLSLVDLVRYVEFVERTGQSAQRWQHALWGKLGYPLACLVMVFLAIPLVMSASRSSSGGRRVLLGALIGLAFHVLNQASSHLGVVFSVAPALSALGPTALLFGVGLLLNRRAG